MVSDNYVTLDITLKFRSMKKMRITSSEPKFIQGRSVEGLINSPGLNVKARPNKCKKVWYAIGNVSKKDLSKIIREFENLPYKIYQKKSCKYEPNDSKFYPKRQLVKCMMRDNSLNSHVYHVRTKMTATKHIPISHICSMNKSELEEFLVDETLSQVCYTDKDIENYRNWNYRPWWGHQCLWVLFIQYQAGVHTQVKVP